jgi:hypothetical protein
MSDLLASEAILKKKRAIPPDTLALTLACTAGISPESTCRRGHGPVEQHLVTGRFRKSTQAAVLRLMQSMHVNRAVPVAHELAMLGQREPAMTSCMAKDVVNKFAEAAPWSVAHTVALLEGDVETKDAVQDVKEMCAALGERMAAAWGPREFLEAVNIAVERAHVQPQGSQQWVAPQVLLMLDAAAAGAVDRFDNEHAWQLLCVLSDTKLEDGKFLGAYVAKPNAQITAEVQP